MVVGSTAITAIRSQANQDQRWGDPLIQLHRESSCEHREQSCHANSGEEALFSVMEKPHRATLYFSSHARHRIGSPAANTAS